MIWANRQCCFLLLVTVAPPVAPTSSVPLAVCTVLEEGFCMLRRGFSAANVTSDNHLTGFDVDMRREVLAGREYTVRVMGTYGELQVRTRAGECDVGWAQFFNTAARTQCTSACPALTDETAAGTVASWEPYRCCTDYSVVIDPMEISALHRDSSISFFESFLGTTARPFFINLLCFVFLWHILFANLIWLVERRENSEQFPPRFLEGIDDAFWWAVVTFTTVGYGDIAPKTGAGRFLAILWMLFGITLCSLLTGRLADGFAANRNAARMTGIEGLRGLRICGYASTFEAWYVPQSMLFTRVVGESVAHCGELLRSGDADVILMESSLMSYWASHDEWGSSQNYVLSAPMASMPMSILYPPGSALRRELDVKFLQVSESPRLDFMRNHWFRQSTARTSAEEEIQWEMVVPAIALLVLYLVFKLLYEIRVAVQRCGKKQRERDFAGTLEEGDSKKSVGVGPMKVQVTERTADWAEGLHHVLTSPFQASLKMARQKTARFGLSRPGSRRPPARETS